MKNPKNYDKVKIYHSLYTILNSHNLVSYIPNNRYINTTHNDPGQ
jgi:hypothetical protein